MNKLARFFSVIALVLGMSWQAQAQVIQCGHTARGEPVNCDLETHRCWRCEKDGWQRFWEKSKGTLTGNAKQNFLYYETERVTYQCSSKGLYNIAKGCVETRIGGVSGEVQGRILGGLLKVYEKKGQECVIDNIRTIYTETCYSCQIVETLGSAFLRGAAKTYDVVREAANYILALCTILWIAFFVLKIVSSFTVQEPMKILNDLFVQLFKVMLAFFIINSGISTILHYTLEPLMTAGTDFADSIITTGVIVDDAEAEKIGDVIGGRTSHD